MTIRDFIKENKQELDAAIHRALGEKHSFYCTEINDASAREICSCCARLNDAERRLWILNDESLYLWARREGVRV